jgi:hypothetical protein
LGDIGAWVLEVIAALGYLGLALLLIAENLFPPIPSEVVLPLAGFLVGRGDLGFWQALLASTFGSVAGALILYALGRYGGRRLVLRYGRLLRVDEAGLDRARLVPTLRRLGGALRPRRAFRAERRIHPRRHHEDACHPIHRDDRPWFFCLERAAHRVRRHAGSQLATGRSLDRLILQRCPHRYRNRRRHPARLAPTPQELTENSRTISEGDPLGGRPPARALQSAPEACTVPVFHPSRPRSLITQTPCGHSSMAESLGGAILVSRLHPSGSLLRCVSLLDL